MVQPAFLRPGDRVGLVAPASRVDVALLQPAFDVLQSWGLNLEFGETLSSRFHQFSAPDAARAADLQRFLDDPGLRAIFAARGGYGSSRLLERLDFTAFLQNPKWLVGFSDITVLHSHLSVLGVESLHAAMPKTFGFDPSGHSVETLRQALFGEDLRYDVPPHPFNRPGVATGSLTGGNLCLVCHLLGSASTVELTGKILFLEEVDEYRHAVDRYLVQLKRTGGLARLAGLIVGGFSDLKDNPDPPFGFTAYDCVAEHVAEYDFPVCFDFPVGHGGDNWALVCGREARLVVGSERVSLFQMLSS